MHKRTNIVLDAELVERAKRIYGLRTAREVVDLALRRLVGEVSESPGEGLLRLRGIGWDGDLDEMRRSGPILDGWLNPPLEDDDSAAGKHSA
jgi:Arc/MetJ family transcription regulator